MNYKETVREIAAEMAEELYSDFKDRSVSQQERYIQFCHSQACIAVRLKAEAIQQTIRLGFSPTISEDIISKHLLNMGLIPDHKK